MDRFIPTDKPLQLTQCSPGRLAPVSMATILLLFVAGCAWCDPVPLCCSYGGGYGHSLLVFKSGYGHGGHR